MAGLEVGCGRRSVAGEEARKFLSKSQNESVSSTALHEDTHPLFGLKVEVPADATQTEDHASAFVVTRFGRFGNLVRQLSNALDMAIYLGIAEIFFESSSQSSVFVESHAVDVSGIKVCSVEHRRPCRQTALVGSFWSPGHMLGSSALSSYQLDAVSWREMSKLLSDKVTADRFSVNESDLFVHFRGGDIFLLDPPNGEYVQPPLAFYEKATEDCLSQRAGLVRVAHEDWENKTLDAYIDFLDRSKTRYVLHSGELVEDLSLLLEARRIISSYGTFIPTIARLSHHIHEVICFQNHLVGEVGLRWRPEITVRQYVDKSRTYMKVGEWIGSAEQRRQMLEFPGVNIEILG